MTESRPAAQTKEHEGTEQAVEAGTYRYGMYKEILAPLMNKNGDLVSTEEEKAEVFNIFASVFTGNLYPHPS